MIFGFIAAGTAMFRQKDASFDTFYHEFVKTNIVIIWVSALVSYRHTITLLSHCDGPLRSSTEAVDLHTMRPWHFSFTNLYT